jgi:hypothetical protein
MKKPHPAYFGYVHTLPKKTVKQTSRILKFKNQLKKKGFDNTELWNLDATLTQFILPRLKAYIEGEKPWHESRNEFFDKALKALAAFQLHYDTCIKSGGNGWLKFMSEDSEEAKQFAEGMKCFGEIYLGLWN